MFWLPPLRSLVAGLLLGGCVASGAELSGHWAESERACQSDGSFVIRDDMIFGEGGGAHLRRTEDGLATSDGLLDVVDVRVDRQRLSWRVRSSGEVLTYVRCRAPVVTR